MTILRQIEKDKTGKEKKKNGNPGIRLKLTDFTNKKYNLSQANSFTLDWRINFGRIESLRSQQNRINFLSGRSNAQTLPGTRTSSPLLELGRLKGCSHPVAWCLQQTLQTSKNCKSTIPQLYSSMNPISDVSCDNESLKAGHPPIQFLVIAVQCCNRLLPSQDERYWKDRFHRFR